MKAISLWQPWASLWLSGFKVHETRHWHIRRQWKDWKPGDRIAVHASVRFYKDHDTDFADLLRRAFGPTWFKDLPTGAFIGSIAVVDCIETAGIYPAGAWENMSQAQRDDNMSGDFYEGRYAWKGADPIILPAPIPFRGQQGIFTVPDEMFGVAA